MLKRDVIWPVIFYWVQFAIFMVCIGAFVAFKKKSVVIIMSINQLIRNISLLLDFEERRYWMREVSVLHMIIGAHFYTLTIMIILNVIV